MYYRGSLLAAPAFCEEHYLVDLDFVRIECDIPVNNLTQLSQICNSFKNFEAKFKSLSCHFATASCDCCEQFSECSYCILFGQKLSSDPEIVRKHQKPSLPFSFYINERDNNIYSIGITIIGKAVNYIELFYSAFIKNIEATYSIPQNLVAFFLDYNGERHIIEENSPIAEKMVLFSAEYILHSTAYSDSVRLLLQSPLRLCNNGAIINYFDFGLFFRSQLRRSSSLAAYYGTVTQSSLDYIALSQAASNVHLLENGLNSRKKNVQKAFNKPGITGIYEFSGLVEDMFSLLLLGSYFNAGKGAAFGYGFYQIEVL